MRPASLCRLILNTPLLLVLALVFIVTRPAMAQPSVVGLYQGLVMRHSGPPPVWANMHLGARIELTVNTSGAYTGKLINMGTPLTFSGQVTSTGVGDGFSSTTIARGSLPPLSLNLNFSEDALTGGLGIDGESDLEVQAWRNVWDAKNRPATGYMGKYNFHLNGAFEGTGYGTFTVPAAGTFPITGKLPDGTSFNCTTFLGPQGQLLIYQTMYPQVGSLVVNLMITPDNDGIPPSITEMSATWFKPPQTSTSDRFFREGFNTGFSVSGGLYLPPAPGGVFADLPDVGQNGEVMTFGAGIESTRTPPGTYFTVDSTGAVTMAPAAFNPAKTTLSVKPASGEFSGTFTLIDDDTNSQIGTDGSGNPIYKKITRTVTFEGLVADNSGTPAARGFFLLPQMPDPFADPPTTATTSPILSGMASLEMNPDASPPLFVHFDAPTATIEEGGGNVAMLVRLSEPAAAARTFNLTVVPGTAAAADVTATTFSVSIPAGAIEATALIGIKQDGLDEEDEIFSVTIADGAGFMLGDPAICEVTILDDDERAEITADPVSQIVELGADAQFYVDAVGTELTYQWRKNGTAINEAIVNPLNLSKVQLANAGTYSVKLTNPVNSVTSANAELAVVATAPRFVAVARGATATFVAEAAGTAGKISYQWLCFGSDIENLSGKISGAKTKTLTIRNVRDEDLGDYACVISQPESGNALSTGAFTLRITTAAPVLLPLELEAGQVLRPYTAFVSFDTSDDRVPGRFSAQGLPKGLSIHPYTGVISGIPTAPVTNAIVKVTATNAAGKATVQATLTIAPYPQGGLGTFHGIVDRNPAVPLPWPRADLGARIEFLTTVTGSLSGKLFNGTTLPFKGQLVFDEGGKLVSTIPVKQLLKNQPPLLLRIAIDPATSTLTGDLSAVDVLYVPDHIVAVHGWRNIWSKTTSATTYLGRYNFLLTTQNEDSPDVPGGAGYGSFNVPSSGTFNITGKLPDTTPFVCNTFLGPQGQLLLYQPLFTLPGSLHGVVQVANPDEGMSLVGPANLVRLTGDPLVTSWNKPPQPTSADKFYPDGFPVTDLRVSGVRYVKPADGALLLDLREVLENAELSFAGGGVAVDPLVFTVPASNNPVLPADIDNPFDITLSVIPETGEFSGSFMTSDFVEGVGLVPRKALFTGLLASNEAPELMGMGFFTISQLPDPTAIPPVTAATARTLTGLVAFTANINAAEPIYVQFSDAEITLEEEHLTAAQISVVLSEPFATAKTIPINVLNAQSAAADFKVSVPSVTFAPGEIEKTFEISVLQDNLDEENERFAIVLGDGVGYNLGVPSRCDITVIDDDTAAAILTQPLAQIVPSYGSVDMTIEIDGTGPPLVQWRKNNVNLDLQIGPTMAISNVQLSDAGSYDAVVTNAVNSVTSIKAELAVVDSSDRVIAVAANGKATFTANYSAAAGSVTFQWQREGGDLVNGGRISGATTKTLAITNASADDEGFYTCNITQTVSGGSVPTGLFALLIVNGKPQLLPIAEQTGAVAQPYGYQVEFDADPGRRPASFAATGLPAGLTINSNSGYISGTPTESVTNKTFNVTASNSFGSATLSGVISIAALPAAAVGNFFGSIARPYIPVYDSNAVPWTSSNLGGRIELTTTPSGSYTGKVIYGTVTHNFAGQLSNDGYYIASFTAVPRPGEAALRVDFMIVPDANRVVGNVGLTGSTAIAVFQAWRNIWSAAAPATAFAGRYHFVIAPQEGLIGLGYGSCTVPSSGTFLVSGRLPDNSPFVSTTTLGPEGQFVVYQPLYTRPGSFVGVLQIFPEDPSSTVQPSVDAPTPTLFKPAPAPGTDRSYPFGIDDDFYPETGVVCQIAGGRYAPPATGQIVLGLPDSPDNALLDFQGASLDLSAVSPNLVFQIRPGGAVVLPPPNPAQVAVTIKPATGEFNGSFLLVDDNPASPGTTLTRTAPFSGLLMQMPDGLQQGLGVFTLPQLPDPSADPPETGNTTPIFTGTVTLSPAP